MVDPPPEAAPGEAASQTGEGAPEGAPHPRRRRRRRRRPVQAATAMGVEAGSDAVAGEAPVGDSEATAEAGEKPAEAAGAETAVEHGGEAPAEAGSQAEGAAADRPVLRLRNRRRRRRPPVLGLMPGHSDPVPAGEGAPPAIAAIRAALAPGQRSFSVPRRQRRHAPLSGEAAVSGEGAPQTAETALEPGGAPPRPRRRRRRRPIEGAAPGAAPGQAGEATGPQGENSGRHRHNGPRQGGVEHSAEARDGGGRERRADGGGQRDRGQRDRGPRDRGDRGGRGAPPRRVVEQKLYS